MSDLFVLNVSIMDSSELSLECIINIILLGDQREETVRIANIGVIHLECFEFHFFHRLYSSHYKLILQNILLS